MSEVRRAIRDRAANLATPEQRTPIDLDDDDAATETQGSIPESGPEPTTEQTPVKRRARSASTPKTTAQPPNPEPQTPPPPAASPPAKPAPRRERRMSIILTDDAAITILDSTSRKLKDHRDQEHLKGQLGNTLLLIMGLRLISELDDSELFELARDCAKYQ